MTERYLEDFQVGQIFGGSARIRIDQIKSGSRALPPNSIRNHSISTKTLQMTRYFEGSRRAVGTPPR